MRFVLLTAVLAASVAANVFAKGEAADTTRSQGPVIVIDPGHGGANWGAPSIAPEVNEKNVTLAISILLAAELRARGAQVIMTRTGDDYLTLRQRSDVANLAGADIFVSIHVNASPDHSHRGFETYILSPSALDVDARALRTIGPARSGLPLPLSRLVDDLERGIAHPRSAELAAAVHAGVAAARPSSPDRGLKQESMHVLLGAAMPAVLVELGFIDHPVEGRELLDPVVQAALAAALADALL